MIKIISKISRVIMIASSLNSVFINSMNPPQPTRIVSILLTECCNSVLTPKGLRNAQNDNSSCPKCRHAPVNVALKSLAEITPAQKTEWCQNFVDTDLSEFFNTNAEQENNADSTTD